MVGGVNHPSYVLDGSFRRSGRHHQAQAHGQNPHTDHDKSPTTLFRFHIALQGGRIPTCQGSAHITLCQGELCDDLHCCGAITSWNLGNGNGIDSVDDYAGSIRAETHTVRQNRTAECAEIAKNTAETSQYRLCAADCIDVAFAVAGFKLEMTSRSGENCVQETHHQSEPYRILMKCDGLRDSLCALCAPCGSIEHSGQRNDIPKAAPKGHLNSVCGAAVV